MSDIDHDNSTLSNLIATTIDSAEGYAEAAKVSQRRFTALFTSRADERREVATQL